MRWIIIILFGQKTEQSKKQGKKRLHPKKIRPKKIQLYFEEENVKKLANFVEICEKYALTIVRGPFYVRIWRKNRSDFFAVKSGEDTVLTRKREN